MRKRPRLGCRLGFALAILVLGGCSSSDPAASPASTPAPTETTAATTAPVTTSPTTTAPTTTAPTTTTATPAAAEPVLVTDPAVCGDDNDAGIEAIETEISFDDSPVDPLVPTGYSLTLTNPTDRPVLVNNFSVRVNSFAFEVAYSPPQYFPVTLTPNIACGIHRVLLLAPGESVTQTGNVRIFPTISPLPEGTFHVQLIAVTYSNPTGAATGPGGEVTLARP